MPSRQDQLHSYQFMVQRVVAALVMRETDPAQSPFRRVAGATLVGVLLATLALGGVAAYAVVSPGGSGKWRDEKAVIVEKESGALYVYRDARLHPVLNYASALLILNAADAKTVSVSRSSIAGAPRGVSWGIVGAPASLPARGNLERGGWTVCSQRVGNGVQSALFVGSAPDGGADLGAKALLVSTPDGSTYMLWKGRKHFVRQSGTLLPSLVWNRPPLRVAPAFVNALPAGTDLARPAVIGRGRSVAQPAGGELGQVYVVERVGGVDYFVVLADGLASLTQLQAELMLADPETATLLGQSQAMRMERSDFTRLTQGRTVPPFAADPGGDGALPTAVPELADPPSGAVCGGTSLLVDMPLPDLSGAVATRATTAQGTVLADRVVVASGTGALITSVAAPGASSAGLFLVTDLGMRYSLPSSDLIAVLGYGGVTPMVLPAEMVALLPAGPTLHPAAAQAPSSGD